MPPLVVKWSKCSVSIASARTTIDHKAYDAVISNMGFVNSVLGDFTVDRQATGWRSARCDIFAPCGTSCGLARTGHARGSGRKFDCSTKVHYSFARGPT